MEYDVLDSIKTTNGDVNDAVIMKDQSAKYKCLQFCNKLLDCVAVNIGQGSGRTVTCQILRSVPEESDKVRDETMATIV